jgi:hypothetical protein
MAEILFVKIRVLFWTASVSILFFSYLITKGNSTSQEINRFLFYSFLLSFLILIDDYFYIHHFFRIVLHIKNTFFYLIYPAITIFIVKSFYKQIKETKFLNIIAAYGLLGLGVMIDLLSDGRILKYAFLPVTEEVCKLLGSLIWLIYFYDSCSYFIKKK